MANGTDSFELRKLYEYLRVVDVCDAMDGLGYFDVGLMDAAVQAAIGLAEEDALRAGQPADVEAGEHRGYRQRARDLVQ